jgi:hypothetical protein
MDVIKQSLDAMRAYLSSRMNGTGLNAKKEWLPRQLVKYYYTLQYICRNV